MDINEQQQINTFSGGMNTDTSDALIDSGQYRYAENLRFITNTDSNSGELHLIEGNKAITITGIEESSYEILAATSVRLYGIIVIKTLVEPSSDLTWSVYRITQDGVATRSFGPCAEKIWDNNNTKPCILANFESENNIKLYIADGIHQLMCIDILSSTVKTTIKEISNGSVMLPPLGVLIAGLAGSIDGIRVQYAYRLYNKYGGASKLSTLSQPLSLYKTENSGYSTKERSGRAVKITVPQGQLWDFNKILIFRISYIQNGQQPEVKLVFDQDVPLTDLIDTGVKDISSISVSDLLSYVQFGIIPKVIESKNNYLFAANIKYKQSQVDELFANIDTRAFSSGMKRRSGGVLYDILNPDGTFNVLPNQISTDEIVHYAFDSTQNPNNEFNPTHWYSNPLNETYGGVGEYFCWKFTDEYPAVLSIKGGNQSNSTSAQRAIFRPEEVYRFGVILYDTEGNASSVKWIADIQMPESSYTVSGGSIEERFIRPTFFLKQAIPNCSKYEIVRCIRTLSDKYTITEGIVGKPLLMKNISYDNWGTPIVETTNKLCPSGFMTLYEMFITNRYNDVDTDETVIASPVSNIVLFASPEYVYQDDDIKKIIDENIGNIKLKLVDTYGTDCQTFTPSGETQKRSFFTGFSANEHPMHFFVSEDNNSTGNTVVHHSAITYYENATSSHKLDFTRNDKTGAILFNHVYTTAGIADSAGTYTINNVQYVKSPRYDSIANGENLRFLDDVYSIGQYTYTAWSVPLMLESTTGLNGHVYNALKNEVEWQDEEKSKCAYPIGTSGKCILFLLGSNITKNVRWTDFLSGGRLLPITVADLRKNALPYGGYNKYAIDNSVYCSFGDVFDATVDVDHPITHGDAYISIFVYNALHNWYDAIFTGLNLVKMGTVYSVPVISDIDLLGLFGTPYSLNLSKGYYIQDYASLFDGYVLDKDAYLYNTAYNALCDIVQHSSNKDDDRDSNKYDTRIHYSENKTNQEYIDSWQQFKALNFLDVDSKYGEITGLRLFKDKLIFWQSNASGVLAVNERVVLEDSSNTQVVLGTGSVLDRYDYFSTIFGMKPNQYADCYSNDSLYWWDGYNKEILCYTKYNNGYKSVPISTEKSIKNYINSNTESNYPCIVYDNKYKEIMCNCVNNVSLVYNELILRFTSVYNFDPALKFNIFLNLYTLKKYTSADGKLMYLHNSQSTSGKSTLFGNDIHPKIKYIVNKTNTNVKTFDILTIGGNIYGGSVEYTCDDNTVIKTQNLTNKYYTTNEHVNDPLYNIQMSFTTPLNLTGKIINGSGITNREYDYRLNIPRQGKYVRELYEDTTPGGGTIIRYRDVWTVEKEYGDRLRGKTLQCELESTSNSTDFSILYIITKYRLSWS